MWYSLLIAGGHVRVIEKVITKWSATVQLSVGLGALQVHAPWCPSCEKVNRVFEKLARHVQKVPSLLMAKFDAQANEHPSLMVNSRILEFLCNFWIEVNLFV